MIQAIGLTTVPCRQRPATLHDVSFEARAGQVTALLGPPGAGQDRALRLLFRLDEGQGIALFRGRPLHHFRHPSREVGALLGDTVCHPARSARGHLRMIAAAAGVSLHHADAVLEVAGLGDVADERLRDFSPGMERRLGIAAALVGDPHSLVLDDPARWLSSRERSWLHGLLREYAAQGGVVLMAVSDPRQAAWYADHVVELREGRVVADQPVAEFVRTGLGSCVTVRTPVADWLAELVVREAAAEERAVEVARMGTNRLRLTGTTCSEVGDLAYRHGILVHGLAEEAAGVGVGSDVRRAGTRRTPAGSTAQAHGRRLETERVTPPAELVAAGGVPSAGPSLTIERTAASTRTVGTVSRLCESASEDPGPAVAGWPATASPAATASATRTDAEDAPHGQPTEETVPAARSHAASGGVDDDVDQRGPVRAPLAEVHPLPPAGPAWPLRYEFRRSTGVRTGWSVLAGSLFGSLVFAVQLAYAGRTDAASLLTGWSTGLPLPCAALGAGLLGALAYAQEYRYPALAAGMVTAWRRGGLLAAKAVVCGLASVALALGVASVNALVVWVGFARNVLPSGQDVLPLAVAWCGLLIGCSWVGLLAVAVLRSVCAGLAVLLAATTLLGPLTARLPGGLSSERYAELPERLRSAMPEGWSWQAQGQFAAVLRQLSQPTGYAIVLSLVVLLGAYVLATPHGRSR